MYYSFLQTLFRDPIEHHQPFSMIQMMTGTKPQSTGIQGRYFLFAVPIFGKHCDPVDPESIPILHGSVILRRAVKGLFIPEDAACRTAIFDLCGDWILPVRRPVC